jgi:hypothetical protein
VEKEEVGGSNNIAELFALREALVWDTENGIQELKV